MLSELTEQEALLGVPRRTVARILSMSEARLQGFEDRGLVRPAISKQLSERNTVRLYGFVQMVELFIVRELEARGRHIRQIQRAVEWLRADDRFPRPLAELRWGVSGEEIFWEYPEGQWSGDGDPGQLVMTGVIDLDRIRRDIHEGLQRPPAASGRIVKRRGVHSSKPIFEGTRVPVAAVHSYLLRGADSDRILAAFPALTQDDVEAARAELETA